MPPRKSKVNSTPVKEWQIVEVSSNGGKLQAVPVLEAAQQEILDNIHNLYNQIYIIDGNVGTPSQTARLILDTGSSDLWFKGVYKAQQSSTAVLSPSSNVDLSYGQGHVTGYTLQDKFCLGALCLERQNLIEATRVEQIGNDQYYDGLLGLGGPALYQEEYGESVLTNYMKNSGFDHPAFALRLADPQGDNFIAFGNREDLDADAKSKGFAGGYSLRMYTYVPHKISYWMVRGKVSIPSSVASDNGLNAGIYPTEVYATLDSGSSLLCVKSSQYHTVLSAVLGKSLHDGSCTTKEQQLPGFAVCLCNIDVNPIVFDFESEDGPVTHVELKHDDLFTVVGTDSMNRDLCRLDVMNAGEIPFWLLGDTFLRKVYAIHDPVQARIKLYTTSSTSTELSNTPVPAAPLGALASAAVLFVCVGLLTVGLRKLQSRRSFSCRSDDQSVYGYLAA